MGYDRITRRAMRNHLERILAGSDFDAVLNEISRMPARRAVSPVIGLFCHREALVRWRAVSAFGVIAAGLADRDMESARVVMRRLMWTLNDESGGIGWGAPEAMGEAAARHARIADEYGRILLSYVREDCNFLEHQMLQRGLLWGIGRLAHSRADAAAAAGPFLVPFLESGDPYHRGFAAWALRAITGARGRRRVKRLAADTARIMFYWNGELHPVTVGQMAEGAPSGPAGDAVSRGLE